MPKENKPFCCQIDCKEDAVVEIRHGQRADDYTHSCLGHIGEMLTDEYQHTITWLYPNPATGP